MRLARAELVVKAATPLALLAVGAMTFQASHAAFSATTTNPSDSWSAGQVFLSDDDGNTAMFTVSNMRPGDTGSKCIVVTAPASQTYATSVRVYATNAATATNGLDAQITLTIEEGTGGSFSNCSGFTAAASDFTGTLNAFTVNKTSYANGVTTSFAPTGGTAQSRTFRFTWTLSSSAPNSAQAGTAGTGFTWEAQ